MNLMKLKNTNCLNIELLEEVGSQEGDDLDSAFFRCRGNDPARDGGKKAIRKRSFEPVNLDTYLKSEQWANYIRRNRAKKLGVTIDGFKDMVRRHQARLAEGPVLVDEKTLLHEIGVQSPIQNASEAKDELASSFLSLEDILSDEEPACDDRVVDAETFSHASEGGGGDMPASPAAPPAEMPPLPLDLESLDDWIATNIARVSTLYDYTLQQP